MSRTDVASQAIQTITTDDTVVALLREISDRLARIEGVGTKPASEGGQTTAVVPNVEQVEDVQKDGDNICGPERGRDDKDMGNDVKPEGEAAAYADGNDVNSNSEKRTGSVTISYPASHPLDSESFDLYQARCDGLLENIEIKDRLSYLPPNDSRIALISSREHFLALFIRGLSASDNLESAKKLCLMSLDKFSQDSEEKKHFHFSVVDYHSDGKSVWWDCKNPPVLQEFEKKLEMKLPDGFKFAESIWPITWKKKYTNSSTVYNPSGGLTAPWCRFIKICGLSNLIDPDVNPWISSSHGRVREHLGGEFLGTSQRRASFHTAYSENFNYFRFQISLHVFIGGSQRRSKTVWPTGPLYTGAIYKVWAEHQSFTVEAVCNSNSSAARSNAQYWTILLLAPRGFHNVRRNDQGTPLDLHPRFLDTIWQVLCYTAHSWNILALFVDQQLDEGEILMSPEDHDRLLFDDPTFKRSRLYFWAIDALSTFIDRIQEVIVAFETYEKMLLKSTYEIADDSVRESITKLLEKSNSEIETLRSVRRQFENHLERTKILRDGLFNASAMIEAKASTQLGENVKLLTYISIFYLPLSFCTSLWSTTDTFNFSALAIAMVLVAATTYLIVFNLNHLVQSARVRYKVLQRKIIQQIKEELTTETWEQRAKNFERFEPDRQDTKPSEWYILLAAIELAYKRTIATVHRQVAKARETTKPNLQTLGSLRRLFFWRRNGDREPTNDGDRTQNEAI